jgi:hypothetical protein
MVMIPLVPSHAEDFTEHYRQTLLYGVTASCYMEINRMERQKIF